ncbi:DUF4157 domain-containing protein [Methanosarcina sp. WWM596]|uniref:eCIS core domain-containing protein n=1 Tax=Methanosarcina sp. WWM596 TaxID=1434103 RepID=UPI0006158133|nr:DUF4157 domain-containing protein [Methanosarcina sp. WWM596]AKB18677.1 hypothetical protein MSWHS_1814 [Methanosarcina sp. WWM596]
MSEHQQIQQSKKPESSPQRRSTLIIQTPVSNPTSIIQRARINPKSLTPEDVLQLQRTIGNRAVGRLLSEIKSPSKVQQAPVQRQEIPEEEEPLQGMFESKPEGKTCSSCIQRQEIPEEEEPIQTKRENKTGMPDDLKAGVESLSGIDMSDVRVHYNSDKPAEVGALAYTQGTNIHIALGQERHLPHEAWHVVQQAQGRVNPTIQLKDGVSVNDDEGLEHEADVMGTKMLVNNAQLKGEMDSNAGSSVNPWNSSNIASHPSEQNHTLPQHALVQAVTPVAQLGRKAKKTVATKGVTKGVTKRTVSKARVKAMAMSALKAAITDNSKDLEVIGRIHKTRLLRPKKVEEVKPEKKLAEINFLRHLSTVINSSNKSYQEVQAAINIKKKEIYISSNSNESELPSDESAILTLANQKKEDDVRVKRHKKKLIDELKGAFKGYKYFIVSGLKGQHAETKIATKIKEFDYVAGQRRPCAACTIFLHLLGIPKEKFNQHQGAYWETVNSLISLVDNFILKYLQDKLKKGANDSEIKEAIDDWLKTNAPSLIIPDKGFKNQGISPQFQHDFDTASESESI